MACFIKFLCLFILQSGIARADYFCLYSGSGGKYDVLKQECAANYLWTCKKLREFNYCRPCMIEMRNCFGELGSLKISLKSFIIFSCNFSIALLVLLVTTIGWFTQ